MSMIKSFNTDDLHHTDSDNYLINNGNQLEDKAISSNSY
jgi:hypothetical protein